MCGIVQLKRINVAIVADKLPLHFPEQVVYSLLIYPLRVRLQSRRYLLSS